MPRNGSGVYSKAANTTAVAGDTILSTKYNSQVDDMVQDLNTARPVTAGGTGATTAAGAVTNLGFTETAADISAMPGTLSGITATSATVVRTFNNTNSQLFPIGTGSYSEYGGDTGAHNFWGGPTSENQEGAGFTAYAANHATSPGDLKLRALNSRPLWFKSTSSVSALIAGVSDGDKVGTWSMEDFSMVDVGVLVTRALTAEAPSTRMRIRDDELVLGGISTPNYHIYNRESDGYLQIGGGDNQSAGFTLRQYGSSTGGVSTDSGLIGYATGVQVIRYREDLSEWDFKTNTVKAATLNLTGLPSSPTGLVAGEVWNDSGTLKIVL